jgi:hypothetical protein
MYLSDELKNINVGNINKLNDKSTLFEAYLSEVRFSFKERLIVHKFKNRLINELQVMGIEGMPKEIPEILTKPFIIETMDNKDLLFGDVISIVGFFSQINDSEEIKMYKEDMSQLPENVREEISGLIVHEGKNYLYSILFKTKSYQENINWQKAAINLNKVAKTKNDKSFGFIGNNTFYILPNLKKHNWVFNKIDYKRDTFMPKNYCRICPNSIDCNKTDRFTIDENYNICIEGLFDNILSFITNFNYLLLAEDTPIEFRNEKESVERNNVINNKIVTKKEEWIIKYMYFNEEKLKYIKKGKGREINKEGLIKEEIKVKGHERNQAYGQGHKYRRRIYIESFTATKWKKEGDVKIILNYKESKK